MPKLQNVTIAEVQAAQELAWDLSGTLAGLRDRIEKNYCDTIPEPISFASSFLSLSRIAADVASNLLTKARMQEQEAELRRLHAERIRRESKS